MAKTRETVREATRVNHELVNDHCGGMCAAVDAELCEECRDFGELIRAGRFEKPGFEKPVQIARIKLL